MVTFETDSRAREESRLPHRRISLRWGVAGLLSGLLVGALGFWLSHHPGPPPPFMRFVMSLPRTSPLAERSNPLAFTRDGARLIYAAQNGENTHLVVRAMAEIDPVAIPGTDGAFHPFPSPDGRWIGYFDARDSRLKKMPISGGAPIVLGAAQFGLGASWGEDDTIVYTPDVFSGLWRVPASGGQAKPLTQLQSKEFTHRWPQVLPGGKTVIFTVGISGTSNISSIASVSLRTGQRKMLLDDASDARYSPTGHLLFLRGSDLMAVRFDPARLLVLAPPFLIQRDIGTDASVGAGHYAVSATGVLAYAPSAEDGDLRSLARVGPKGEVEKLTVNRGAFSYPRLSPDGRRLAVVIRSSREKSHIWTMDVANGTFQRLTTEGSNLFPVWTPDGNRITFASDRNGQWCIYWVPADGSAPPELLRQAENPEVPNAWSSDGVSLIFTEFSPETGPDIWILSLDSARSVRPFLRSPYAEWGGAFSPDRRWLAYTSNDSGLTQVYVQPFPGPGERFQISTAEGREPVWSPDGHELFFRYWKGLMGVSMPFSPETGSEPPRLVVAGEYETGEIQVIPNYDVSADGTQFIMIPREAIERMQIQVNVNWFGRAADVGGVANAAQKTDSGK
jgi:hypothetical protein